MSKQPTKRIQVTPAWSFHDESGNRIEPQLFKLLTAIHEQGKLTKAAEQVGISYRHSWNLLNKWSAFFGCDLVELQKGKGAKLTALGDKLLWAEQRVIARLEPQLKSMTSELNIEIQRSLEGVSPLLRLHASYGYAVELLPDCTSHFQLDLQYRSAEDALASLNRGQCDVAGFHVPTEVVSEALITKYSSYLRPRVHKVIRFITRTQGLMVKADNPKYIKGLGDLVRDDVRFINRQKYSGTRALIDELLERADVDTQKINGFDDEEFTHSAVAAYVASGMADVGIGVEVAARQFGLGFIPLTTEHYLLLCHQRTLQQVAMQRLLSVIRGDAFQTNVGALAGYDYQGCGDILAIEEMLPWYRRI